MKYLLHALLPLSVVAAHAAAVRPVDQVPAASHSKRAAEAIIRVNSTIQPYDYARPWEKKTPFPRRGTGAILEDGNVLVTAEMVANKTHIEVEKPLTGDKSPAEVTAVDYDANLALLKPTQSGFLDDLGRLDLAETAAVGDSAEILQIETNGEIARTPATLTTITVMPYPMDSLSLLLFRISAPLQNRDGSFVLPVVRNGRLLGMLMRYDSRTQTGELAPAPVIARFLADAASGKPEGFPRLGISFAPTRDPQFRKYLGMDTPGGVYLVEVLPDSPAARAGLQKGDVLLTMDGKTIDQDGLYEDPRFGKILFTHLITSRPPVANPLPVTFLRAGQRSEAQIAPAPLDRSKMISEPYDYDRPPRYVVLGGLVFQELSRGFLREWGANWRKSAPQRLVYLDAFQSELPPDRGKIVFLSAVLSSPDTLGYENLENLVVTKVNGIEIRSLDDLARAVRTPENGFHRIEFEEDPGFIILDANSVEQNAEALARDYGISALQRL